MLFLYPFYRVTQLLGACYAICYADWVILNYLVILQLSYRPNLRVPHHHNSVFTSVILISYHVFYLKPSKTNSLGGKARTLMLEESFLFFEIF